MSVPTLDTGAANVPARQQNDTVAGRPGGDLIAVTASVKSLLTAVTWLLGKFNTDETLKRDALPEISAADKAILDSWYVLAGTSGNAGGDGGTVVTPPAGGAVTTQYFKSNASGNETYGGFTFAPDPVTTAGGGPNSLGNSAIGGTDNDGFYQKHTYIAFNQPDTKKYAVANGTYTVWSYYLAFNSAAGLALTLNGAATSADIYALGNSVAQTAVRIAADVTVTDGFITAVDDCNNGAIGYCGRIITAQGAAAPFI